QTCCLRYRRFPGAGRNAG
ncbi:(2Fe-2S)-binding protein, partial [Glaciimonas sp. Cout2]